MAIMRLRMTHIIGKPSICLSMIVKDEAHCISKCLNSVKPFIDYWVICDTGSTDNTEEVIAKTLNGIPGEFHKHEWKNFSFNRNQALRLSRTKADYVLMLDADDYLSVTSDKIFQNLTQDAYNMQLNLANLTYSRPQLVRSTVDCGYIGVLHEYLQLPPTVVAATLPGCIIRCGRDGARSKDANKYLKDAQLLKNAIKDFPDDPRNYFYCAQSFRDANKPEVALRYYLKRAEMTHGYHDERYCSYLEAGKLIEKLRWDDLKGVTVNYLKAYECNPNRAESLTYLATYYRKKELLSGAYLFAKAGAAISKPTEALFLEDDCYDWKIHDELAVAGYWMGRYREAAEINERLLLNGVVPTNEQPRIFKNLGECRVMIFR